MRIFVIGDIHGILNRIIYCNRFLDEGDIVIQIGDLGVDKNLKMVWEQLYPKPKCKVYFIGGNHENYDIIDLWNTKDITEVASGLFYIPRGIVMNFGSTRIGFLGGGESVDRGWRIKEEMSGGVKSWWEQERITQKDVDRLVENAGGIPLDILITHTPPAKILETHYPINRKSWDLPEDWVDVSSRMVDQAVQRTQPKRVVSGHMHFRAIHDLGSYTVQILDIEEIMLL